MKQFLYRPVAFVLTLLEMVRDPAAFFDPTKEAPSGHTGENRFGLSGPKQEHNR